ncbi:aminotransferase class IV family protein [Streptomyces roseirectus]|uniref:Aminotransferase class IV family protein n=1 Tax=Streptomyces roseirectus TaxID=2768066 RepID=A0A7H0I6C9_9ACTN|nr:aminotransferase class IV [Streptomyces roseirectus]QNP68345.1 aminotransferase class IV family protein [Streptomyces roseirectus]
MVAVYPHVFFRDRWVTRDEATVPIGSLAMRYGLSVFEGVRLYAPSGPDGPTRPFLLQEHLARMAASLRLMRFPDPGLHRLPGVVDELIDRNRITRDAYVRIAATPLNAGQLGDPALPELSVTATPMDRKRWLADNQGMDLSISDRQRGPDEVHPPTAKNIANYAGPRLAWQEAREAGFDGCVLTNRHGRLSEAPTAALFLVEDGVLSTPALSEDVLPGITRAWVLRTAAAKDIPVRETALSRRDAYRADEAFLCGTGLEFAPVRSFDRRWFSPSGHRPGPVTRELVAEYFLQVREQARAPHLPHEHREVADGSPR